MNSIFDLILGFFFNFKKGIAHIIKIHQGVSESIYPFIQYIHKKKGKGKGLTFIFHIA